MRNILHYLGKIHDSRKKQGQRYKLKSILSLILLGYTSGCTNLAAVYRFGKQLKKRELMRLGFADTTPSHPTLTETMKRIDPIELETLLGEIVNASSATEFQKIAIDGKSIRSTGKGKNGLLHLLSAYAPEISGVLLQTKSKPAGGEIIAAEEIIKNINITGKIITGDAMFAQEVLSSKIKEASGDYVFKVKRNKKRIISDIEQGFALSNRQNIAIEKFEKTNKAHGRIDRRVIESLEVSRKYFGGWGTDTIKRIAKITKTSFNVKTNSETTEIQFLISSLCQSKASSEELLNLSVRHWAIENNLHRARDTNFKEDICNIICHKSQQICAAVRNLAIFLLKKIDPSISNAINKNALDRQQIFSILKQRI